MLAQARILVLVKVRAVEKRQAVGVGREMRRYPVQDHADPVLVQVIHEVHEIFRRAVPAGGREIARRLVAPRFIEWMLHHRQQLHVREAHFLDVVHQLLGKFAIVQHAMVFFRRAPPRAEVNFVDRQRRVQALTRGALGHPCLVVPGVAVDVVDNGGRLGPQLCIETEGVGLQPQVIMVAPLDFKLVNLPLPQLGNEKFPHAAPAAHAHGVTPAVPMIEIAHHAHALGVRRPHRKRHAPHAGDFRHMCAQLLVSVVVRALCQQVKIEVRQERRESIGILKLVLAGVFRPQAVGEHGLLAGEDRFKESVRVNSLEWYNATLVLPAQHPGMIRAGQERANRDGRLAFHLNQVHPQDVEGVGVLGPQDKLDLLQRCRGLSQEFNSRCHRSPFYMRKPPSGEKASASPAQTAREGSVPHCGRRPGPSLARNPVTAGLIQAAEKLVGALILRSPALTAASA